VPVNEGFAGELELSELELGGQRRLEVTGDDYQFSGGLG